MHQLRESEGFDIDRVVTPGINCCKTVVRFAPEHIEKAKLLIRLFCEAVLDKYNRDMNLFGDEEISSCFGNICTETIE